MLSNNLKIGCLRYFLQREQIKIIRSYCLDQLNCKDFIIVRSMGNLEPSRLCSRSAPEDKMQSAGPEKGQRHLIIQTQSNNSQRENKFMRENLIEVRRLQSPTPVTYTYSRPENPAQRTNVPQPPREIQFNYSQPPMIQYSSNPLQHPFPLQLKSIEQQLHFGSLSSRQVGFKQAKNGLYLQRQVPKAEFNKTRVVFSNNQPQNLSNVYNPPRSQAVYSQKVVQSEQKALLLDKYNSIQQNYQPFRPFIGGSSENVQQMARDNQKNYQFSTTSNQKIQIGQKQFNYQSNQPAFSLPVTQSKPIQSKVLGQQKPLQFRQTGKDSQKNILPAMFEAQLPAQIVKTQPQFQRQGQKIAQNKNPLIISKRQSLEFILNRQDDFLTHHLKFQLSLFPHASARSIRRRQILEHHWVFKNWGNSERRDLDINFVAYDESLFSAWMQRTFLQIWEEGHDNFFNKHEDYKLVRRKIAQQYMFQLYQLKEFADSGLATINFLLYSPESYLNHFLQYSDQALLNLFAKLKDRYPQTSGAGEPVDFPDVPSTKTSINLLDNFPSLSFTDPNNLNYQTIYEDINFLLKSAIQEQKTFKADMMEILGEDVLACPKVGQVTKQGKTSFNAIAVRRVFVKWCQNLLEKCPDLHHTRSFLRFVQTRQKIANNFIFKSSVQQTTHKIVIDTVSLLLEAAKYTFHENDKQKREEFIFNIYDLLRCKIKRGTPAEIVGLLQKMKRTKLTKNGKRFEVVRVKNRFKTNNRDLLINFRYGDVLVGEAQLCVDSTVTKIAKMNYDFCHYIYELERSIFGPTLELMMEYEDNERPDITVKFQAEDLVQIRGNQTIDVLQQIDRKCMHGHNMISLIGDIILSVDNDSRQGTTTIICNYCNSSYKTTKRYDFCFLCACTLCTDCREEYKKADRSKFYLSVDYKGIEEVKALEQVLYRCDKWGSVIAIFLLQGSTASGMLYDTLSYHMAKVSMQPKQFRPILVGIKYANTDQFQTLCLKYKVEQFPTLVLMNGSGDQIRTVIGMNLNEAAVLIKMQQLLLGGQLLVTGENCWSWDYQCCGPMEKKPLRNGKEVCLTCFGASRDNYLSYDNKKSGMYCENNHYRCLNCCYAALPPPTTYKDYWGQTYLTSDFTKPLLRDCPKGHKLTLSKKPYVQKYDYNCFSCRQLRYYDNQHGVGECEVCQCYLCPKCMGAKMPSLSQLSQTCQLVKWSLSCTAEEAIACICGRHFKKIYRSLALTAQDYANGNKKLWSCHLCQKTGSQQELHLACIACEKMTESKGEKASFQICYECAAKSKMIQQQFQKKEVEQLSEFICPRDGEKLVLTSFAYQKKLTIQCVYCLKTYYGNSRRFYCKKCHLNCCHYCQNMLLESTVIPTCKQKCRNGHNLTFALVGKESAILFCDGCYEIIRKSGYFCQQDGYNLCEQCVKTRPADFVGTAFSKKGKQILNVFTHFIGHTIPDGGAHGREEVRS